MQAPCRTVQRSLRAAQSINLYLPPAFLLPAFCSNQTSSFSTSTPQLARQDGNINRGVSPLRHTGIRRRQVLSVVSVPKTGTKPPKKSKKGPKPDLTLLPPSERYRLAAENPKKVRPEVKLPKPVLDPAKRTAVQTDDDHGLWGFFNHERTALTTPEDDSAHGRGWTVPELRAKDWEDLHRLWWVCTLERNKIFTSDRERERSKAGYGAYESDERDREVSARGGALETALNTGSID